MLLVERSPIKSADACHASADKANTAGAIGHAPPPHLKRDIPHRPCILTQ